MNTSGKLAGIFVPVVTPFTDETPDLKALRSNLGRLRQSDVAGYLALGSNGEFRSLSETEAEQVIAVFAEEKGERVLIVGAGTESTSLTVRNCRIAAAHGANYASLITPYYFAKQMNDAALLRHYVAVADASPIPVTIYNIPGSAAGVQVSPKMVKQLARHPNIAGIKDSSPAGPARFLAALDPRADFSVLSGSMTTLYPSLCIGARGGVISLANIIPSACVQLYQLFAAGDHAAARELHSRLVRLNEAVSGTYGVPGVKAAMGLAGLSPGAPRLPLMPLGAEETAALARVFRDNGFPLPC